MGIGHVIKDNLDTCKYCYLCSCGLSALLASLGAAFRCISGRFSGNTCFKLGAFLVFIGYVVISLTDKLDGYLARSRNEVTTFGKFLDPIADKLAVVVALFVLLEWHMVSPWVLLVIVAREFLVSGVRMVVASKGVVIAPSDLG